MHHRGEEYGEYRNAVLAVVSLVPAGKVLTYGDVAEILERGGPRQVGAVMSRGNAGTTWWRVIRAGGQPPTGHEAAAVEHYLDEETPLRRASGNLSQARGGGGYRVDMGLARWFPDHADQDALQAIRRRLARNWADEAGMSERDGELSP